MEAVLKKEVFEEITMDELMFVDGGRTEDGDFVVAGCVIIGACAGALTGGLSGASSGSAVPVIGTVLGGIAGAVGGAAAGALAGLGVGIAVVEYFDI